MDEEMPKKIIKIEVEVANTTTNEEIEYALKEKIKEFCKFNFWKGTEAKINISDSSSGGGEAKLDSTK